MRDTAKLAILKWWASLNATQKLNTWQSVIIFVLFNGIVAMALAYNSLRIEKQNEIRIEKAKTDQVNENWILYLQESIKNDRELYYKTKMLDEQIEKNKNENRHFDN